jgi:serine/threonine protein kinase
MPRVHIKGKGQVDLTNNDFVAEGGQGKVFAKGKTVYKVYHDPKKMIPEGKIGELAAITFPNVIKPEDLLIDGKGKIIGYTMNFVPDTHPLCKVFTKAFRQREGVKEDQILKMVRRMQETLDHIHGKNILVVDLNEMNFLASPKFDEVYFLDVDSYQTPGFPATALMESVRDRHAPAGIFSRETDYFALGIVTFQLFIGIHPYKGKHPSNFDMDTRMQKNISVFNKDVAIPAVCYPLTNIPKVYLDWYTAMFEKGLRVPPPKDLVGTIVIVPTVQAMAGSNFFDIVEVAVVKGDILNYYHSSGSEIIVAEDGVFYNGREDSLTAKKPVFGFTPKMNHPIAAYQHNGNIDVYDIIKQKALLTSAGKAAMSYKNRIYIQGDAQIYEVLPYEGKEVFASVQPVANVLEKATQMFEGVVVQNLLGSHFFSVFPESKHHQQIAIKEIAGYKVIDAKFDSGVLMVVGVDTAGKYDRFVFRFAEDWTYDMRVMKDITYSGLNFTVLDNGVCVAMNENENIEIFSIKKDSTGLKEINDPGIDGSMKLYHRGTKVLFSKGNKLHSMTMRTK